ncbi:MAG: bifunctional chorismate mutase/prephenate dehydrogenase [Pseudanabaenales cyanobacterium]|nr:bifunctional chorismate mutase/prephenate dehydrogenase [Pseudanabaenales cyanobacterium]
MIHEKLQQIDRELIELLGKRIAVLKESVSTDSPENAPDLTPFLHRAGIPEFVWQNLVLGCAATLTLKSSSSSPTYTQPRQVTVIGGGGRMGRFFTEQLSAAGHQVSILEQNDWEQAERLLAAADLVLVCVPMECTLEVIRKTAKHLGPNTALADITSIKAATVKAMLAHHGGPVMGLHPMFGPGVNSFLSHQVVVCPGRRDESFQWFLELIEGEGGKLIVATPEEHDQMMVSIQAIRNFATLSMGVFLSEEEINIRRSLDFSSPIFRQKIAMVTRLFTQSAPLVVDLILATPERREAIARLANTYSRLAQLVLQGERESLIHEFKATHSFFAGQLSWGLQESTHLINALSTLLAAREVEQEHPALASRRNSMDQTLNSPASSTQHARRTPAFSS